MGDFWRGVLKGSVGPRDNDSRFLLDVHTRDLPGEATMRRYDDGDEVDLVVVGAGGSVLAQRLARAGWRVVVIEAGPFWHPDEDWVSDEAGSTRCTGPRTGSSAGPIRSSWARTTPAGGSAGRWCTTPATRPGSIPATSPPAPTTAWVPTGRSPITTCDRTTSRSRASCRWPGRTGRGVTRTATRSPRTRCREPRRSCTRARAGSASRRVGPVGIVNGTFGNRPHCIYRGYCLQGCKVNAKASPYVTHLPDALAHDVEIRADAMALRMEIDDATGRARGVVYARDGDRAHRLQRARFVALACYSIETPRLLLNSTSRRFPRGLCNTEDQVGRYVMVQGASQTAGRWPEELRQYKAPPPEISSEQFYETDTTRGFARGFSIQTVSPLPIGWAEHVLADGHWGRALREYMRDYNHWATVGVLNELLAHPDNRITLADQTDSYGLPVARMDYSLCANDKANMAWSTKVITDIVHAAGAQDVLTIQRFAHLIGGARMGGSPETSVVDANQRSWAVPNLFLADGSVCPTQGSANPALTIMALASRLAERMAKGAAMSEDPAARAGRTH